MGIARLGALSNNGRSGLSKNGSKERLAAGELTEVTFVNGGESTNLNIPSMIDKMSSIRSQNRAN